MHDERIIRDGRRLRIEFAPGSRYEGQTVVETPAGRFLLDPRRREIRTLPTRADETGRRLGRLVRMVRAGEAALTSGDGGRVAGRPVRRLVLSRGGKAFVALSIDPRTAVVLRRETFGGERGPLGTFVFTRFEPRARVDAANFVLPKTGYRRVSPLDDLRALGRREGIAVRTLPASSGYRLEGARSRRTPAGTIVAAFFSGPDGKRLTLFAAKGELPDLGGHGSGNRPAPPNVELYRWRAGTTNYGLLGEESPARLRALAGLLAP